MEYEAALAANLSAAGYSHKEIGRKLGWSSPAKVTRRIRLAERLGYLKHIYDPRLLPTVIRQRVEEYAVDHELARQINELNSPTKARVNLQVFDASTGGDFDKAAELFAQRAAFTLATLLLHCESVAVAHGSTIRFICEALRREQIRKPDLRIFPASGAMQDYLAAGTTAFDVAEELARACGATPPKRFDFQPFTAPSQVNVNDYIEEYGALFTGPSAHIRHVDALLTTASSEGRIFGLSQQVFENIARRMVNLDPAFIRKIIVGDFCGALLPEVYLTHDGKKQLALLQQIWTGLHRDHIISIVKRAARKNMPGVVLIAFGKHKREVVLRALRLGWVNTLIIDFTLATALKNELPPSRAPGQYHASGNSRG